MRWSRGSTAGSRLARGDAARARAAFDAARDADPVPWRVLGRFNEHLRALARAARRCVADADAAFRREARDGLVGFEWVADNCHPTPLGSALIARELLAAMAGARLGIASLDGLPAARGAGGPVRARGATARVPTPSSPTCSRTGSTR